jgi:hypothetical protein
MSAEVASAFVTLVPSFRGGQAAISRELDGPVSQASRASGHKAGGLMSKGMGGVIGGAATKMFAPLAAAAAAIGIGGFLMDSVSKASDLSEAGNKINAVFGKDGAKAVNAYSKGSAKSIGQSTLAALDGAATFGTFGKAAGLAGKPLAKFATGFSDLSADMASFYNTSPEEAVQAIGSALRGEAEPIRKYGVLLDDATLRQEALKLGLVKTTKEALTPQQKVLAAQSAIYKQTKDAQGDFAKTSGGLANQQRILGASFDDIKARIGAKFLPMLNRLAAWFINDGLPAIERFGGWLTGELWPAIKKGYDTILPGIRQALSIVSDGVGDSSFSWKDFGRIITDIVIPVISKIVRVWLPYMAVQIRSGITVVKALWAVFLKVGHIINVVIIGILDAFASLARGFATMLRGLSKVPGFGWAKDAADKMDGAADKADRLKEKVKALDRKITLDVSLKFRPTAGRIRVGSESLNIGMREKGGPVKAGQPYVVGEKRPELFVPKTDGYIAPSVPTSFDGGGSGGGATFHLYDADGTLLGTMRGAAKAEVASQARGLLRGTR